MAGFRMMNRDSKLNDSVTDSTSTDGRLELLDRLDRYFAEHDRRTMRTWLALMLAALPQHEVDALAIRLSKRTTKPK
jgi:hypothetical protein